MRNPIFFLAVLTLCACSVQKNVHTVPMLVTNAANPQYNDLDFWAAHPYKWDPSDSVPAPLRKEKRDTVVDVFFIHPTTYTGKEGSGNADLSDAALNRKTDESTILYQATAFNQHARVFAPRYRQAHYATFFMEKERAAPIFDTAYGDVRSAFLHYLQQYNNGRPVIIAAHSQGSKMAIRLLREFFDGTDLQRQLVAAYVVGWPVLKNEFTQLPVCSSPNQIGCFTTWRTFREGYVPDYVQFEQPRSFVTNPLTWRTDTLMAPATLNKGSVLRNFNKVVPHTTDARVADGVLWVHRPKFPGSVFLNTSNYHIGDINLFFVNIRENVAERIGAFMKNTNVNQ